MDEEKAEREFAKKIRGESGRIVQCGRKRTGKEI